MKIDIMAEIILWSVFAIIILILLIAVVAVFVLKKKKGRAEVGPDYRTFFFMGLSWLCIGAPLMFIYNEFFNGLAVMGVIFTIVGAANIKKWKKRPFTKNQKISWVLVFTAMMVLVAFVWYIKAFF